MLMVPVGAFSSACVGWMALSKCTTKHAWIVITFVFLLYFYFLVLFVGHRSQCRTFDSIESYCRQWRNTLGWCLYTRFRQRSRFGSTGPPRWAPKYADQKQRLQTFGWCRNSSLTLIGRHRGSTRWLLRPESTPLVGLTIKRISKGDR